MEQIKELVTLAKGNSCIQNTTMDSNQDVINNSHFNKLKHNLTTKLSYILSELKNILDNPTSSNDMNTNSKGLLEIIDHVKYIATNILEVNF